MKKLEEELEVEEFEEVPSIIVGEFNKDAVYLLQEFRNSPPGIVLIRSEGRNGISFLLEYGFSILKSRDKILLVRRGGDDDHVGIGRYARFKVVHGANAV